MVASGVETKLVISPVTINVLVEDGTVPVFSQVEGRVYAPPGIYCPDLATWAEVLEAIRHDGMRPMNAPELLDAKLAAAEGDLTRKENYATTSLLAAGKTRQGTTVYVVAHTRLHPLTNPARVRQGRRYVSAKGAVTGHLLLSNEEFWDLLDMEDGTNKERDVYVFSKKEADELLGKQVWSMRISDLKKYERFLTALVRGEDRKNRLMAALLDYQKRDSYLIDTYDISGLNDFERDGTMVDNGPVARFLSFYSHDQWLIFNSGHFTGWVPRFAAVPEKQNRLEEAVENLVRKEVVKPKYAARASELLRPFFAER